jgi:molybdate transport system substrate-binding protein
VGHAHRLRDPGDIPEVVPAKARLLDRPVNSARNTAARVLFPALLAAAVLAPPARAQEVTVSAAISTKDAVEEIGRGFMRSHPGVTLRYSFGSSGELQQQIEAGAPVDLFISASQRQMDELARRGLIRRETHRVFARNVLTVVTPADSRLELRRPTDLLEAAVGRIVVGNPKTVPAGQYAAESLRALGLWDKLQPRIVFAENVRQALDYVSRGEVDAGFVYTTDAATRPGRVREAFRPAQDSYGPILYPVAVLRDAAEPALAAAFLDRLVGPEGHAVLKRFGFEPPPAAARR